MEKTNSEKNIQNFVNFQKFPDMESLSELISILNENEIPYKVDDRGQRYSLVTDPYDKFFIVKIREQDIEKTNSILNEKDISDFNNHNVDHYLYTFSDEDIIDVIANPEEWTGLELRIANKIVADRNLELSADVIRQAKKQNVEKQVREELKIKKEINKGANWFLVIAILSVLNSIALILQLKYGLIFGLGITQVFDGLLFALVGKFTIYNLFMSLSISSLFVFFWYHAKKNKKWAFLSGMIFYGIDALIFLFVNDWVGFGLHFFVLGGIGISFVTFIRKQKEQELKTLK